MAYGSYGFKKKPFRRFGGPREMHKITCSECGQEGEVPFKPREGTPVLCKECYMKKKGITPRKPVEAEEEQESEESEEKVEEESNEEEQEESEESEDKEDEE